MLYIISGLCVLFCAGVIIFCLKVLKENRKPAPPEQEDDETGVRP